DVIAASSGIAVSRERKTPRKAQALRGVFICPHDRRQYAPAHSASFEYAFPCMNRADGLEPVHCHCTNYPHASLSAKGHLIVIPRATSLLSSLLTLLPCCAFAQSSVVMYGYLDLGLAKRSGDRPGIERGYNNWLGF